MMMMIDHYDGFATRIMMMVVQLYAFATRIKLPIQYQGLIQCVAVNHVGKAVASTDLCVFCVPRFASEQYVLVDCLD